MKPEDRKRLKQHIEMIVEHKEPTQTEKILRDAIEEQIKGKLELEDKNRELRLKLYTLLRKEAEEQRFIWWIWNVYAKNVNDLILSIISATTYDNETMAKLGKYGLPMKCFEFLERVKEGTDIIYGSDRIYDGTYLNVEISTDVKKGIPENKPEPSNSDVSMTRDVSTDVKTPSSIENTNPDYYKQELARRDEIITRLKEDAERLASTYVVEAFPHEWVCRGGCHHWARFGEQLDHAPDCPITLHRALMKELE